MINFQLYFHDIIYYLLIIDLKIFIIENKITFKRKILIIDCAKYVKAAARKTLLQDFIFSLNIFF